MSAGIIGAKSSLTHLVVHHNRKEGPVASYIWSPVAKVKTWPSFAMRVLELDIIKTCFQRHQEAVVVFTRRDFHQRGAAQEQLRTRFSRHLKHIIAPFRSLKISREPVEYSVAIHIVEIHMLGRRPRFYQAGARRALEAGIIPPTLYGPSRLFLCGKR